MSTFAAHDERHLGVRLQTEETVDDVHVSFLEGAGPIALAFAYASPEIVQIIGCERRGIFDVSLIQSGSRACPVAVSSQHERTVDRGFKNHRNQYRPQHQNETH